MLKPQVNTNARSERTPPTALGRALATWRAMRGLSHDEFAFNLAGKKAGYVSAIVNGCRRANGKLRLISVEQAIRWARNIGAPLYYFVAALVETEVGELTGERVTVSIAKSDAYEFDWDEFEWCLDASDTHRYGALRAHTRRPLRVRLSDGESRLRSASDQGGLAPWLACLRHLTAEHRFLIRLEPMLSGSGSSALAKRMRAA